MLPVRLVIFDMDGLMFDTERIAVEAWRSAGERFGYPDPPALVIETIGLNRRILRHAASKPPGAGFPYPEARRLRIQYAEETVARSGVPVRRWPP